MIQDVVGKREAVGLGKHLKTGQGIENAPG